MARDFQINGETLVLVKGHGALTPQGLSANPQGLPSVKELGLASESITIIPRFVHKDVYVDDFGPEIPTEVMFQLAEVRIRMTLVHYDVEVLQQCITESMAGGTLGTMAGAGIPMGGYRTLYTPGNHYIGLNLLSPVLDIPWFFLATYIETTPYPVEIPIGTSRTLCVVNWRAIPYMVPPPDAGYAIGTVPSHQGGNELKSRGVVLWNHTALTPFIPGGLG